MNREGPPLESLTRRLAETPEDFLAEPLIGKTGAVSVAAVVSDVLYAIGGRHLTKVEAGSFQENDVKKHRNRLSITLVTCWLIYDPWFQNQKGLWDLALNFLITGVSELSMVAQAGKFVSDPDRREELVRLCLKDLGFRPAGESVPQAQDRLSTLSSVERQRVIKAARLAEERARAIREEMARKAKAEADAKMMRE